MRNTVKSIVAQVGREFGPRTQEQIPQPTKWAFPVFIEEAPLAHRHHAAWSASDPGYQPVHRQPEFDRTSGGECRPDRDFPLFVRWYREGKLKLDELATRRYALKQFNEAVDDLEHGRILGRAIITYA